MNGNLTLDYEPLVSLDELLVRLLIRDGGQVVFDKIISGNDTQAFTTFVEDAAKAIGIGVDEMEKGVADCIIKARDWWQKRSKEAAVGFQAKFISSADLEKLSAKHRWLIKRILVRDQPVMWGGPKKSMKTTIMLDAAISLGSGKPFLGEFEIPKRVKVAVLSGESGSITIRETALRIAKSKGVPLASCDVLWGFDLPRLGVEEDVAALAAALKESQVEVLFVDPAYLCLLAGNTELQANNMFQIGPLLMRVAKVCGEIGATLILVHHTTKPAGVVRMQAGDPLELEDLAYAGFQEFARQWVLVNRREKYEPGSGKHVLWLNVGGSAGQSGCWGLDINEGILLDDFSGRTWKVEIRSMEDALKEAADAKNKKKEGARASKEEDAKRRILQVLSGLDDGETSTGIAKLAGIDLRWVGPALADLAQERRVALCDIVKRNGKGSRVYPGFRLVYPGETAGRKARQTVQDRPTAKEDDEDALGPVEVISSDPGVSGGQPAGGGEPMSSQAT